MEIFNRKAHYEYEILDRFDAGMILLGSEIKSIRNGDANINDAYVFLNNGEVWLKNMYISKNEKSTYLNHEERRERKLLLNKSEIQKIEKYLMVQGTAIIPIKIFFAKKWAKVQIAIGRGKKVRDKRNTIKERDLNREMQRSNNW